MEPAMLECPDRLIDLAEASVLTGYAPRTIRAMIADGRFIAPKRLGRKIKWWRRDVLEFLASLPSR